MGNYTVGSLFAGIGGIDLAFEWAGFETAWQVEREDYPRRVLDKHWPGLYRPHDVRGCTGRTGKGWRRYDYLPRVDVLVGGFPCQDISVAGRGAGIRAGTRSGLWFEFARLIGELRPRIVFLENVPAITTRDGTIVVGSLAELGYDAQWGLIRASDAGAPQRRERWFCVAYANDGRYQSAHSRSGRGVCERDGYGAAQERRWDELEYGAGEHRQALAHAHRGGLEKRERLTGDAGEEQPPAERSGAELANAEYGRRKGWEPQRGGTGAAVPSGRAGTGTAAQPRLGRGTYGLPRRLDFPGWPARPGEEQYEWEPPRVARSQPHRTARLRALGNAVVPQVVYPLAVAIREWLEAEDAAGSTDVLEYRAKSPV